MVEKMGGLQEKGWIPGEFWVKMKFSTSGCSDMIGDDVFRT